MIKHETLAETLAKALRRRNRKKPDLRPKEINPKFSPENHTIDVIVNVNLYPGRKVRSICDDNELREPGRTRDELDGVTATQFRALQQKFFRKSMAEKIVYLSHPTCVKDVKAWAKERLRILPPGSPIATSPGLLAIDLERWLQRERWPVTFSPAFNDAGRVIALAFGLGENAGGTFRAALK
jgi:hypothetical protein